MDNIKDSIITCDFFSFNKIYFEQYNILIENIFYYHSHGRDESL